MIKESRELIKKILEKNILTKDDDKLLLIEVWKDNLNQEAKDLKSMSVYSFFELLKSGVLANPETIRRTRQKLQEEVPALRGKTYRERKTVYEKEVREEVRASGFNSRLNERPNEKNENELF